MSSTNLMPTIKVGTDEIKHISIIKNEEGLPIWDLFELKYINGPEKRNIKFVSEHGVINKNVHPEILRKFVINRLTGENNLMDKQGHRDIVFIGTMYQKNGQIRFTRNYNSFYCKDGKNAQQMFDLVFDEINNLRKKKPSVVNKHQVKNNYNRVGKTYIMSDIHGMYGSYMEAISQLSPEDHLIINGDVIDRGNGGIKILLDIIERKKDKTNNPKITFLMGNHEMQMLQVLGIMVKHNLSIEDVETIINYENLKSSRWFAEDYLKRLKNPEYEKQIKYIDVQLKNLDAKYNQIIKKINNHTQIELIKTWLNANGGLITLDAFSVKTGLTVDKRNEIYTLLRESNVVLPIEENNQKYLIVHNAPPKKEDTQNWNKILNMKPISWLSIEQQRDTQYRLLEERENSEDLYGYSFSKGFVTICGHTPGEVTDKKFIRLDGNCGHRKDDSKLILYNLTDNVKQYFDENEESITRRKKL